MEKGDPPAMTHLTGRRRRKTISRGMLPLLFALGAVACEAPPPGEEPPLEEAAGVDPDASAEDLVRTADPFERGYTEDDFPRVQELAEGVYSYEQLRSAGDELFTTVSFIVVTEEGVLVADGQGNLEETERLVEEVGRLTDQPITHVVISSDHGDHTSGNAAFPDDAEVIAHPVSAKALIAMNEGRGDEQPPIPEATWIVEEDVTELELGGRQVELHYLGPAHTGGDLVVYLPEERILFMSETFLPRIFPAMRTAHPSEWARMLERAQAMDVNHYIPGHGFVDPPEVLEEELEVFRRAVVQVTEEVERLHGQGLSLEEAQEAADFGELEEWSLVSSQGSVAVQQVYRELDEELPDLP